MSGYIDRVIIIIIVCSFLQLCLGRLPVKWNIAEYYVILYIVALIDYGFFWYIDITMLAFWTLIPRAVMRTNFFMSNEKVVNVQCMLILLYTSFARDSFARNSCST